MTSGSKELSEDKSGLTMAYMAYRIALVEDIRAITENVRVMRANVRIIKYEVIFGFVLIVILAVLVHLGLL